MSYRFHPDARHEYLDGILFYRRIERRLGRAFIAEVQGAITSIAEFPYAYPEQGGVRRCVVHRFPYVRHYTVEDDGTILLVAVAHASRRPGYWRHRLQ